MTLYYIDQGSGLGNDASNWFEDSGGTIPHGLVPTAGDDAIIYGGTCDDTSPFSSVTSITVYSTGTLTQNSNIVVSNQGIIGTNIVSAQITVNNGTVISNNGYIDTATNSGSVTNNAGGTINDNSGPVTTNTGGITSNAGTVDDNAVGGTIDDNKLGGVVTLNNGSITLNHGVITTNNNTVYNNYYIINTNNGSVHFNMNGSSVITTNNGGISSNYGFVTTNNVVGIVGDSIGEVTTNNGIVYITGNIIGGSGIVKSAGTLNLLNHTAGVNVTFPIIAKYWW